MKIAHVSDLHFGCIEPAVIEGLTAHLIDARPDLVIASGDITQSSTDQEFRDARTWFDSLKLPVFAIPGNHDLPGMDLTRFVNPFARYRHHIARDLEPEFRSDTVHIKGLNSARRILPHWNWANGAISPGQCRDLHRAFDASTAPWRMCVLHHPVMNPKEFPLEVALFNRHAFTRTLDACRIDLVLAGHQHHAYTETRESDGHATLFLNASTATSKRLRRQPNGFNMLNFTPASVRIDMLQWTGAAFETLSALTHTKHNARAA
ncbi:metallophosphoesterase family protein [Asticcacaulis solisilvae]|uniref:metallophosphoesterase family protein n=1 Tax=Asticcacaulis solisilvae TaxID=1217274 RepID=UPI003FD78D25